VSFLKPEIDLYAKKKTARHREIPKKDFSFSGQILRPPHLFCCPFTLAIISKAYCTYVSSLAFKPTSKALPHSLDSTMNSINYASKSQQPGSRPPSLSGEFSCMLWNFKVLRAFSRLTMKLRLLPAEGSASRITRRCLCESISWR
jgi:hypothetical protein